MSQCQQKFSHPVQQRSCRGMEWVSFEDIWKHGYDKLDIFLRTPCQTESCVNDFGLVFVVAHFSLFSVQEEQKKSHSQVESYQT